MKKLIVYIFVTLIIIFALCVCQYSVEPKQIIAKGDSVTLKWDEPAFRSIDEIIPLESYQIYYRRRGEINFIIIDEIPADSKLEYTLYHKDFGDGMYEFAVSVTNQKRYCSRLHTSFDQNSDPFGGWYLFWIN